MKQVCETSAQDTTYASSPSVNPSRVRSTPDNVGPPCPPEGALRIGSFVNEKRLERIKDYIRESNGDCTTVYEDVSYIDQYLPTPSMAVSTFFVASIAASTPLILNAIKPLTKQLIKRLGKSKDKST